jgi:hypothetical protein
MNQEAAFLRKLEHGRLRFCRPRRSCRSPRVFPPIPWMPQVGGIGTKLPNQSRKLVLQCESRCQGKFVEMKRAWIAE